MRAFFCVPVAGDVRGAVALAAHTLRDETRMRASWVMPRNYHVTVRFLGEIDPMMTLDLGGTLREVVETRLPFRILLDRVGAFPSLERPRVLWVGGPPAEAFADLVGELNRRLEDLGFESERRPPMCHVTVARIKGRPDPGLARVADRLNPLPAQHVSVDRIALMESRPSSRGAEYSVLLESPLVGRA